MEITMATRFMGIDQSYTNTGYCVLDQSGTPIDFGTYKTSKEDDVYDRALSIANFIISKVKEHKLDGLTIEGLAFGIRGDATRDLAGLIFTIITHAKAYDDKLKFDVVAPTSLKKFATQSGKADKKQMIAAVPTIFVEEFIEAGYKKTTGLADICDAYWLAKTRLEQN